MKRALFALFGFVLLATVSVGIANAGTESGTCVAEKTEDLTPDVTARLAGLDVAQVGPAQTTERADGTRISSAPIEARDEDGKLLFGGTMTCTSLCTGPGTCSGSGCNASGLNCSSFTCSGGSCTGSCKKVIIVEIR